MPSIGFTVFKEKILNGSKRQTIRPLRKNPIKVGDRLYLFWHLRRKDCEKLREATCIEKFYIKICTFVYERDIEDVRILRWNGKGVVYAMSREQGEDLGKRDGFENLEEMIDWLSSKYGDLSKIVFQVIRWDLVKCHWCKKPIRKKPYWKTDIWNPDSQKVMQISICSKQCRNSFEYAAMLAHEHDKYVEEIEAHQP